MKKIAAILALAILGFAAVATPATASHGPAPSNSDCASQPIIAESVCLANWAAAWSVWLAVAYSEVDWVAWGLDLTWAVVGIALGIVLPPVFCAVFEEPIIRVATCI